MSKIQLFSHKYKSNNTNLLQDQSMVKIKSEEFVNIE